MFTFPVLAALAVAYSVSLAAHADCVLPPAPSKIPDGKTASEQEMVTAMQTLKEYNAVVPKAEGEAKRDRDLLEVQAAFRDLPRL